MKKWLETVFNPYTQVHTPAGMQRLLIMDGHDTHVQLDFLDSCWSRGTDCVILPANMTSIFQPLDVALFNQLKLAYNPTVQAHLLHSSSTLLSKGLFWRWHQQALRETATSRTIRPALRKAGLWPLNQSIINLPGTPPSTLPIQPATPRSVCIGRTDL